MEPQGNGRDQDDLIHAIGEAGDFAVVRERMGRLAGRFGFGSFAFGLLRIAAPEPMVILGTYPEEWVERYVGQRYHACDPVVALAARRMLPFDWKMVGDRRLARDQRRVMDEGRSIGLVYGWTIPVHGPGGELGALSLATDASEREFADMLRAGRHCLQSAAVYCHAAVVRMMPQPAGAAPVELTGRERECLRWTSQGKTAWEVSAILHVSERTVKFHIQNAMAKLGVCNKTQAVARSIALGLIAP